MSYKQGLLPVFFKFNGWKFDRNSADIANKFACVMADRICVILASCILSEYHTIVVCVLCLERMPVLPKQPDETEFDRGGNGGGVWSSAVTSSAWTSRRPDDGTGSTTQLSGDDTVTYCCLPSGCPNYLSDPICLNDLGDAVKVGHTAADLTDNLISMLLSGFISSIKTYFYKLSFSIFSHCHLFL